MDSFLIEITSEVLKYKDEKGEFLVENIRDAAQQVGYHPEICAATHGSGNATSEVYVLQKGTGKWTTIAALDYGVPVTLIG